jgi:hypothetical protein
MSFRICCPKCGAFCNVSDDDVGKTALCGNCDEPIIISRHSVPAPNVTPQPNYASPSPQDARESPLNAANARALTRPISGRTSNSRRRWGCLLAVVVGGFVLVFLLLPTVSTNREAVGRHECSNNLQQIGLALHNYHDTYGSFPPAYVADENGRPMHSWRVLILPFMEEQRLYDQYNFDEPWDGPNNRELWPLIPDAYTCPSAQYHDDFLTPYQVLVGPNAVFEAGKSTSLGDIYDGASNTILVVEAARSPVHWMEPTDLGYDRHGPLAAGLGTSNHDDEGLHVLYADGSVRFLDENISDLELRSLIERSDGIYHVR